VRGIDTAATGLMTDEAWQQILANDFAQMNTPGFKSEMPVIGSFQTELLTRTGLDAGSVGSSSAGAAVVAQATDWSAGTLQQTGNPLDVAIEGSGFFAVQTPSGVRYTQAGDFSTDAAGDLVTPQGYLVLSSAGKPLQVGSGASIAPDGTVRTAAGAGVGQVGVWNPATASLTDTGGGLYSATGTVPLAKGAELATGVLEQSNVEPTEVLAAMIQVLRHFQAGQEFVSQDTSTIDRFLQEAG